MLFRLYGWLSGFMLQLNTKPQIFTRTKTVTFIKEPPENKENATYKWFVNI